MVIDAHQHFWRFVPEDYTWIDSDMATLRRDFLPRDLAPELERAGVDGTIAVQARQTLAETRWLIELAEQSPAIRGVVGWVPLAAHDVAGLLDELRGHSALRGVRHVVQDEPDPDFLAGDAFNAGVRCVGAADLAYDLLIKAHQLAAATAFVDRHPSIRIVLDHIAKPVINGAPPAEWSRQLHDLGRRPHVYCKFSGVVTEMVGPDLSSERLQEYFDVALEAFGPKRLMFGSDWPVCLLRTGYLDWLQAVHNCATRLSADEQAWFWGRTATQAYKF